MHARQDPGLRVVLRRTVRAGYPDQVRLGIMYGTLNNESECPICGRNGLGYPGDWHGGGTLECEFCGTVITVTPETVWHFKVVTVGTR